MMGMVKASVVALMTIPRDSQGEFCWTMAMDGNDLLVKRSRSRLSVQ